MTAALRLVIFDVDGTLVDSQHHIQTAMESAFNSVDLAPPDLAQTLGIVGLSLPDAMRHLAPRANEKQIDNLVANYKKTYMANRSVEGEAGGSRLYPHAREVLDYLASLPDVLLGVATGNSRRGLDRELLRHDLSEIFATTQVADNHPSKPHPSMIFSAMQEAGVDPANTVMIGDTSFDMDMGKAAGVQTVAVTWGYHEPVRLGRADSTVSSFSELPDTLRILWGR